MKNTFKKIAASVMAVASLAVGVAGISANAAECHNWKVRYVGGGAPGSADLYDTWTMETTTGYYTGKCTYMTAKGTTHVAYIYTNTHSMVNGTPQLTNGRAEFNWYVETIKWKLSGDLAPVTYNASCYGNGQVNAEGSVCC